MTPPAKAPGVYARLYCSIRDHEVVASLTDQGFRLYIISIAYARERLTDGRINTTVVSRLTNVRHPSKAARELVDSGLWVKTTDGYQIADWERHQETREEVDAKRSAKADAGRKGAHSRWQTDDSRHGTSHGTTHGSPHSIRNAERESERERTAAGARAHAREGNGGGGEGIDDPITRQLRDRGITGLTRRQQLDVGQSITESSLAAVLAQASESMGADNPTAAFLARLAAGNHRTTTPDEPIVTGWTHRRPRSAS